MLIFLSELTRALQQVLTETHYLINRKVKPIYPYMTFSCSGEPVQENQRQITVDVDIFNDKGGDDVQIEQVVSDLVNFVEDDSNAILTDELFIRFDSIQTNYIPTGSDILQRRHASIICRCDWRKK